MFRIIPCAALLSALLLAPTAFGQDMPRYQLQKTENGVVRLDTVTGEMTYCRDVGDRLDCGEAAANAALAERIAALEARLAALEKQRPGNELPTDEELERSFSIMEKFMRHFKGFVEEWETDPTPENQPLPQKT